MSEDTDIVTGPDRAICKAEFEKWAKAEDFCIDWNGLDLWDMGKTYESWSMWQRIWKTLT